MGLNMGVYMKLNYGSLKYGNLNMGVNMGVYMRA